MAVPAVKPKEYRVNRIALVFASGQGLHKAAVSPCLKSDLVKTKRPSQFSLCCLSSQAKTSNSVRPLLLGQLTEMNSQSCRRASLFPYLNGSDKGLEEVLSEKPSHDPLPKYHELSQWETSNGCYGSSKTNVICVPETLQHWQILKTSLDHVLRDYKSVPNCLLSTIMPLFKPRKKKNSAFWGNYGVPFVNLQYKILTSIFRDI